MFFASYRAILFGKRRKRRQRGFAGVRLIKFGRRK
jgi:hypothetical protein